MLQNWLSPMGLGTPGLSGGHCWACGFLVSRLYIPLTIRCWPQEWLPRTNTPKQFLLFAPISTWYIIYIITLGPWCANRVIYKRPDDRKAKNERLCSSSGPCPRYWSNCRSLRLKCWSRQQSGTCQNSCLTSSFSSSEADGLSSSPNRHGQPWK